MESLPPHTSLHALVRGRVQGVGYRNFVHKRAANLGLSGWVRNLPDGSVEVLAGGERMALEQLVKELHKGPMFAKVAEVNAEWDSASPPAGPFDVAY